MAAEATAAETPEEEAAAAGQAPEMLRDAKAAEIVAEARAAGAAIPEARAEKAEIR